MSDEILSQEEINALLETLEAEEQSSTSRLAEPVGEDPDAPVTAAFKSPVTRASGRTYSYDFRRPDKFSKEQLRTLQMLHETFARIAGTNLSSLLRSTITVELIRLEQCSYGDYIASLDKSCFGIVNLNPLNGEAVLEMEYELILSMIDKLLGGSGKPVNRRALTDIEVPLYKQMMQKVLDALRAGWEAVLLVEPRLERVESSGQFVQIAPPNDIIISILFEVQIGEQRGAMSLCIPHMLLKPITTKLSAQKWYAAASARKKGRGYRDALIDSILESPLDCSIELGSADITVQDLLSLEKGNVVRLAQRVDGDSRLLIGGAAKFGGRPALEQNRLVFNVTGRLAA